MPAGKSWPWVGKVLCTHWGLDSPSPICGHNDLPKQEVWSLHGFTYRVAHSVWRRVLVLAMHRGIQVSNIKKHTTDHGGNKKMSTQWSGINISSGVGRSWPAVRAKTKCNAAARKAIGLHQSGAGLASFCKYISEDRFLVWRRDLNHIWHPLFFCMAQR